MKPVNYARVVNDAEALEAAAFWRKLYKFYRFRITVCNILFQNTRAYNLLSIFYFHFPSFRRRRTERDAEFDDGVGKNEIPGK
jgi:hypothetical protein